MEREAICDHENQEEEEGEEDIMRTSRSSPVQTWHESAMNAFHVSIHLEARVTRGHVFLSPPVFFVSCNGHDFYSSCFFSPMTTQSVEVSNGNVLMSFSMIICLPFWILPNIETVVLDTT